MDNYRIVVISDTHQMRATLNNIISRYQDEAVCFIHLGDCCHEVDEMRVAYPDITLYNVRGNGDFDPQVPLIHEIAVGGKRILFTHGHQHHVGYGLEPIKTLARNAHADILLYGHTHVGHKEYDNGLYIMNPGSPALPRSGQGCFGIIDIGSAGIVLHLVPYKVVI